MSDDKAIKSRHGNGFIVDGAGQFAKGVRAAIKKEVEQEFAERISKAKWLKRLRLRRQMRSEIDRRTATEIAKQKPSKEALW